MIDIEGTMKRTLLLFALGLSLTSAAWAQSDSTNAPPPRVAPSSILSPEEDQEVNKAKCAAVFADPSLDAEERALWTKFKAARDAGQRPGADVMTELDQYNTKLYAAMIKIDPKVELLLAKLDAAHPHHQ